MQTLITATLCLLSQTPGYPTHAYPTQISQSADARPVGGARPTTQAPRAAYPATAYPVATYPAYSTFGMPIATRSYSYPTSPYYSSPYYPAYVPNSASYYPQQSPYVPINNSVVGPSPPIGRTSTDYRPELHTPRTTRLPPISQQFDQQRFAQQQPQPADVRPAAQPAPTQNQIREIWSELNHQRAENTRRYMLLEQQRNYELSKLRHMEQSLERIRIMLEGSRSVVPENYVRRVPRRSARPTPSPTSTRSRDDAYPYEMNESGYWVPKRK